MAIEVDLLDQSGLDALSDKVGEGGTQAAFCPGTVDGDSGGHCELHDASSRLTLDTLDGHLDDDSPKWASGMRN